MPSHTSNNLSDPAQQLRLLSTSAEELFRRGQFSEASQVYEHILEVAPYHVQALDFLATRAYERGDLNFSLELLERSCRANPQNPITYQNLSIVHKARGELDVALEAINHALKLKPSYSMALLHRGSILESLGHQNEMVRAYLLAWAQSPRFQQLLHSQHVPVHVRELISHSADVISRAKIEFLEKAFAPLRIQYDFSTFQRAEQFADLYLGRTQPKYKHIMQCPAFLYFPNLRPQAFLEREDFDWIQEFESVASEIREELLVVLQHTDELQPYVQVTAPDPAQWRELNYSSKWNSYHLYKGGERIDPHCWQCPVTAAAVEKLPLVYTPGHSPEVFFSILQPGTHIPSHYGLTNYKLAVHLPLIIPGDCAIRVGDETRIWTVGQCLVFDDSFLHEAWNNSQELRAVLILEIWNPQLSEVEQQAVAALLGVIQNFNLEYIMPKS